MINNTEFADRLRRIMDHYQLSGSAFAERIQVQRSSISHLLSGRNKPSLDFVMRVVKEFDDVELYWLLNGKGNFPDNSIEADKAPAKEVPEAKLTKSPAPTALEKEIERIVVFYNDGSFKSYLP
jgi:transcriptional regulator with XRE-family HTH domain